MTLQLSEGKYFGNVIKYKEYPYFHCSITRYQPGERINDHYHENSYLSLLINGSYVEDHAYTMDRVDAGKIMFRPCGYIHANTFNEYGGACLNIEFKAGLYEFLEQSTKFPQRAELYQTGHFLSAYKLLISFTRCISEEMCEEFILDWLFELCKQPPAEVSLPWFTNVKRILHSEVDDCHSLCSLAKRVFVHPVYLARAFKQKTGLTIGEYQMKLRLQRSLGFLFNSRMPIHEVAFNCGFYDAAHFINAFKLIYNISPSRFRTALES